MKKSASLVLALLVLAGTATAQRSTAHDIHDVAGQKECVIVNGQVCPKGSGDYGNAIWDNLSQGWSAWWSGATDDYINLDWGTKTTSSGLPDHVVDGFTLSYGTNNMDPYGDDFSIYYFDSCTGWGNLGQQEAGFAFSSLPNGYGLPTFPPGFGWIWTATVDLEGSGYEFLLNENFGIGMSRDAAPTMGSNGMAMVNRGFNGTQNHFDIYYPNGTYNGTWWFGTHFWASWGHELFGSEGEADMTFYGEWSQGNDAHLYAIGDFSTTGALQFIVRKNQLPYKGHMLLSSSAMSQYVGGSYDVTRLVGNLQQGSPHTQPMEDDSIGDFAKREYHIPSSYRHITYFFQAILSDPPATQPPMDCSNGMRAN